MPQMLIIGTNDPNIAYLLQRYAEESGYQSAHICQSEEVLQRALELHPALIVLDVELVETTQWQMVRQLKTDPATSSIPIIIYSCLDQPSEDRHAGVDGFLNSAMYDDFVAMLERTSAKQSISNSHAV